MMFSGELLVDVYFTVFYQTVDSSGYCRLYLPSAGSQPQITAASSLRHLPELELGRVQFEINAANLTAIIWRPLPQAIMMDSCFLSGKVFLEQVEMLYIWLLSP